MHLWCAVEASSPEGVRSISAGYGTIARMAAAEVEAAARGAAAAAAAEQSGSQQQQQLQRAPGGSADSGQRLQNLSFNTYGDLAVREGLLRIFAWPRFTRTPVSISSNGGQAQCIESVMLARRLIWALPLILAHATVVHQV